MRATSRLRFGLPQLSVLIAGLGLLWLLTALPTLVATPNWAEDFEAYGAAVERLAESGTLYRLESLAGGFQPQGEGYYLYPPPFAIGFSPIAGLDAETGALAWYLLKVGALALAAALLPVRPTTRLLAFGVSAFGFAVVRDLTMGNVSLLLLLALSAGWRWLDRPAGSIALGLATAVKGPTGVFLLWFAARRAWRPLAWMVATGLVVIVLSLPFVGLAGYLDYASMLTNVSDTATASQNRHVAVLAAELGLPATWRWSFLLATWILALGAVLLSTRRDPSMSYIVTASATLILAPLIWDHYLVVLMLPAAFLFERGRRWGIVLPLCSWAPAPLLPLVAVAALLLPFLARGSGAPASVRPTHEGVPAPHPAV
jgi:hypothetical protein